MSDETHKTGSTQIWHDGLKGRLLHLFVRKRFSNWSRAWFAVLLIAAPLAFYLSLYWLRPRFVAAWWGWTHKQVAERHGIRVVVPFPWMQIDEPSGELVLLNVKRAPRADLDTGADIVIYENAILDRTGEAFVQQHSFVRHPALSSTYFASQTFDAPGAGGETFECVRQSYRQARIMVFASCNSIDGMWSASLIGQENDLEELKNVVAQLPTIKAH